MPTAEEIAEMAAAIEAAKEATGLGDEALARALDVSWCTVYRWRRGLNQPRSAVLRHALRDKLLGIMSEYRAMQARGRIAGGSDGPGDQT